MSSTTVPYVRKLIPCLKTEITGEGENRQYVLTEPLAVIDMPKPVDKTPVESSQVARVDLSLFVMLTGGLGTGRVFAEVRYSPDDKIYRRVGGTRPIEIHFTTANRGVKSLQLDFTILKLPLRSPGLYEFCLVALDPEDPDKIIEMSGERAELRVLSPQL